MSIRIIDMLVHVLMVIGMATRFSTVPKTVAANSVFYIRKPSAAQID
jgi:hypothetical protein